MWLPDERKQSSRIYRPRPLRDGVGREAGVSFAVNGDRYRRQNEYWNRARMTFVRCMAEEKRLERRMIVFCMQTILVLCFSYFFVVSYFKNKCSFIRYNFEIIRLEWNKLKGHVNISIVKRFKNTFWYFIFCCFWLKMGTKLFILCIFYIVIYILHYVSPRLYDNVGTF